MCSVMISESGKVVSALKSSFGEPFRSVLIFRTKMLLGIEMRRISDSL